VDHLFLVGIGGFAASLVDGALGMGFGPTSSSILLFTGLQPAAVSSTVNLVKVATGLAALLFCVGVRILIRFSRPLPIVTPTREDDDFTPDHGRISKFDRRGVRLAATAGGITNGMIGTWGPIVTPFLLHKGLPPRYAIGSVNTAEVVVAVAGMAPRWVMAQNAKGRAPSALKSKDCAAGQIELES
jgi:uncharacterized protein